MSADEWESVFNDVRSELSLLDRPRGDGGTLSWFGSHCQFPKFLKRAIELSNLESPPENTKRFLQLVQVLLPPSQWTPKQRLRAATLIFGSWNSDDETIRKVSETLAGMLAASCAALGLAQSNWVPGQPLPRLSLNGHDVCVSELLKRAVESYGQAWGLAPPEQGTKQANLQTGGITDQPKTVAALKAAELSPSDENAPAWLAVHRLLHYLMLDAPDPTIQNPVRARVLFYSPGGGAIKDLHVSEYKLGPPCWFIDPITLGLTALAANFIRSVQIGWEVCRTAAGVPLHALQLIPKFGGVKQIDGESAGAITACAMFAALRGEKLNADASASVALVAPEDFQVGNCVTPDSIRLGPVDGLNEKLKVAFHALTTIAVVQSNYQESQLVVKELAEKNPLQRIPNIEKVATLNDVYKVVTGDERIERVLTSYAAKCVAQWDPTQSQANIGNADSTDLIPTPYVEPHLAQLVQETSADDFGQVKNSRSVRPLASDESRIAVRVDTETELFAQEIAAFFQMKTDRGHPTKRICVLEDANGGKTVFSKRLKGYLGTPAGYELLSPRPVLVARFENTGAGFTCPWPQDQDALLKELGNLVEPFCQAHGVTAQQVVDYAIKNARVVLILDALDQAGDCQKLLNHLNTDRYWLNCLVIITGRTYKFALDAERSSFPGNRYAFATLLGLDENQQTRALSRFLTGAGGESRNVRELLEGYTQAQEQLAVPGMLKLAFDLATAEQEFAKKTNQDSNLVLRGLRTRADFYWKYYSGPLLKAASNTKELDVSDEPKWLMMMAVTAFRMILAGATDFCIPKVGVDSIRIDVQNYCENSKRGKNFKITPIDWKNLDRFSVLTDHGTLEARDDGALAWRHKGWMEFFGAVFLGRFAEPAALREFDWPNVVPRETARRETSEEPLQGFQGIDDKGFGKSEEDGEDRRFFHAVLGQITNASDWQWSWKFLAQLRAASGQNTFEFDMDAVRCSLEVLFSQPVRGRRPTDLMYYCWPLLEDMRSKPHLMDLPSDTRPLWNGETILKSYQDQFTALLTGSDLEQARVATQLVPESELEELIQAGKLTDVRKDELLSAPPRDGQGRPIASFARIPAGTNVTLGDSAEQRQFESIPAFLMQSTTVTREQYALFDAVYLDSCESQFKQAKNDGPRCPAIHTDWYDAFCFARWCAAELPSEWQWEYACRAGSPGKYCRAELDGNTIEITKTTLGRVAYFDPNSKSITQPVGQLQLNVWNLYDMLVNVCEWCEEWDTASARRVYRGSSAACVFWFGIEEFRGWSHPANGGDYQGFRLSRAQP